MHVRVRGNQEGVWHYGTSSQFNVHALAEIIVNFVDDKGAFCDCDSVFTRDVEVEIGGKWIPFNEASRTGAIIPDNYNTSFSEPKTDEDRKRGYTL